MSERSMLPDHRSDISSGKLLEETLKLKEDVLKTSNYLMWAFFNATALIALIYNLLNTPLDDKSCLIYKSQWILAFFLGFNTVFHLARYSYKKITLKPVCIASEKRTLYGIGPKDSLFRPPPPPSPPVPDQGPTMGFTATYPMNLSATSCISPSAINEGNVPTRPARVASTSWLNLSNMTMPSNATQEAITDELSLSKYLDAFDEHERHAAVAVSVESVPSSIGSFWRRSPPRGFSSAEVSPILRRTAYQVATVSPVTPTSSPGAHKEETGSPSAISQTDLWRRFKIDPTQLTQWNANLRMWISLTILQRVVAELDHIDAAFVRCGLSDLHLGSVGLDRLKRTACIPQVVASIPSLPRLVPFLELSQHQEYLVTRIRELAKGGSMSEYRWNSGGSLHGKPWEEHLPTDATLVMHMIATYLDLQLIAPTQWTEAPTRPFSSQHFVRSPERPPAHPHGVIIYQPHLNPPHFMLVDKDEAYDVSPGRNNLFHTFLLFLHLLKTREYGMLGPLNLGRSGVNVLWVIES